MKEFKKKLGFSSCVSCGMETFVTLFSVIFFGSLLPKSSAYNVDTEGAMVHSSEIGSMFGFAVAQHIDQSTSWLLIGAPQAQTSQPGVKKGGAVYRCRIDKKNYCQEIPFDQTGNNIIWKPETQRHTDTEDKSGQWLGATVKSSGENGVILACAPRYVYFSNTYDKREPVGKCFLSKASTTSPEEFAPCKTAVDKVRIADQYHRNGYCQLGYSATFSNDGRNVMIAAIGSWYWQGQLYNYRISDGSYIATEEGEPSEDDTYMGYSSAVGDFDGDRVDDYVVGIPKGNLHSGKIAIFNQNMSNLMNISGEQVGSYFGYSLAVTDLNGDQLDDIIVGAPLYSDFKSHTSYETGRVYIYYQTSQHTFKSQRKDILDGQGSKSRFGHSLTGLGDINKDGFNDLGVGAPYAGEDGRGAVYIYHGTRKGIITQVSQIIFAKDLDSQLSTFGFSLSGGQDQDGNTYPDLLVGAYASDKAVFLKTRPVVRVTASLKIDPDMINLDTKSCTLIDDTRITCFTVYTCLEYSGIGVPEELFFVVSWELDVLQRNRTREEQRAYFLPNEDDITMSKTIKLPRKATWCTSSYAYVRNDIQDKLTPIAVDFKFKLKSEEKKRKRKRRSRSLRPILDQYIPTNVRTEAQILKHCGRDNICIPDLVLNSFRISAAHIIGDRTELEILIMVENRGEDAYNTQLWINLPPGVSYKNADAIQAIQEAPVSCRAFFTEEAMVLCDLGNPLPRNAKTNFTLRVAPKDVNGTKDDLEFALHVNSSNPEQLEKTINNFAAVTIPVTATAKININGKTEPEQININTTKAKAEGLLKREIEHVYELRNYGKSSTKVTALEIYWPSHDSDFNLIFPIIGQPIISEGVGTCKTVFVTPSNNSGFQYGPYSGNDIDVILQNQRLKRSADRTVEHRVVCSDWCTVIQCRVGYMKANDNFLIKIRAELNVPIFLEKKIDQMHLTSQAYARVLSMPYKLKNIDPKAFDYDTQQVTTEITADRPDSGSRPIEIWIIAVSVSGGLLVLLLIVILLWWCGFFKRWQPEDHEYMLANGGTSKMDVDNKMWE